MVVRIVDYQQGNCATLLRIANLGREERVTRVTPPLKRLAVLLLTRLVTVDQYDLALDVEPGVVVIVLFLGCDSITGKDQFTRGRFRGRERKG